MEVPITTPTAPSAFHATIPAQDNGLAKTIQFSESMELGSQMFCLIPGLIHSSFLQIHQQWQTYTSCSFKPQVCLRAGENVQDSDHK